jgi:CubicO group peptidase (beta-lactamase class C family)
MRIFVWLPIWLTVALLSLPSVQAAKLDGLEAKIDAFVSSKSPHPDTGVAVGVVENGRLVFFKGYGKRDREKNLPVTENTIFAIGSCSKAFTSLGVAMLADEGKLSLDEPVKSVLPDFLLSDPAVSEQVTLTDMLTHRVGMPRHDLLWYLAPFTADELFERLPYLALSRKAGKGFREAHQYNNLMYMAAGRAIEAASGQRWEDFTKDRIFTKLGMNEAQFSPAESQSAPDFAFPYAGGDKLPFKELPSVAPAGAINASTADMVKWVAFWQRDGLTQSGERLLSDEMRARLFRKESSGAIPRVGVEFDYGLGWFLNKVADKDIYWHAGNIDGFSAHVSFLPGKDLGLVILTNEAQGNVFQLPWKLVQDGNELKLLPYLIYEHLLRTGDRDLGLLEDKQLASYLEPSMPSMEWPAPPVGVPFVSATRELEFYDLGYGKIILREQGSQLGLDYYGNFLPLKPTLFPDVYVVETPTGNNWEVRFQRVGEEIVSVSVPFEPEVDPILFVR